MARVPRPYYLYERGYTRKQLNLGSLVFGKSTYSDPTQSGRHCTHDTLFEESQLEKIAVDIPEHGKFSNDTGSELGLGLEIFQFAKLNGNYENSDGVVVEASKGQRVELLDVASFFRNQVMTSSKLRDQIRIWLCADSSIKKFKKGIGYKPHLWLLTGFIELEGPKVDSAIVGAATGVPIGEELSYKTHAKISVAKENPGSLIWAARYERLDATFIEPGRTLDQTCVTTRAYAALYSAGSVRGEQKSDAKVQEEAEEEKDKVVSIGLTDEPVDQLYSASDSDEEMEEKYWQEYKNIEGKMRILLREPRTFKR